MKSAARPAITAGAIKDEIASTLQAIHEDWSVNPHMTDHTVIIGFGVGAARKVFEVSVKIVDGRELR